MCSGWRRRRSRCSPGARRRVGRRCGWGSPLTSPSGSRRRCGPGCRSIRPAGRQPRASWSNGCARAGTTRRRQVSPQSLLTDVVDSSTLWEQSPQRVPALLAEMQLIVDRNVEDHGGRRIGATVEGDTTVSVFPSVASAVRRGDRDPTGPGEPTRRAAGARRYGNRRAGRRSTATCSVRPSTAPLVSAISPVAARSCCRPRPLRWSAPRLLRAWMCSHSGPTCCAASTVRTRSRPSWPRGSRRRPIRRAARIPVWRHSRPTNPTCSSAGRRPSSDACSCSALSSSSPWWAPPGAASRRSSSPGWRRG